MKACVLVVDDDDAIRESLVDILTDEGHPAFGVANGQQALEYLRKEHRPCVILLDLMMPIMDGASFRANQLKDPQLSGIPVAVITAAGPRAASGVPAEAVLAKPLRVESVLDVVSRFCTAGAVDQ